MHVYAALCMQQDFCELWHPGATLSCGSGLCCGRSVSISAVASIALVLCSDLCLHLRYQFGNQTRDSVLSGGDIAGKRGFESSKHLWLSMIDIVYCLYPGKQSTVRTNYSSVALPILFVRIVYFAFCCDFLVRRWGGRPDSFVDACRDWESSKDCIHTQQHVHHIVHLLPSIDYWAIEWVIILIVSLLTQ